jgi:hypothetical protein
MSHASTRQHLLSPVTVTAASGTMASLASQVRQVLHQTSQALR